MIQTKINNLIKRFIFFIDISFLIGFAVPMIDGFLVRPDNWLAWGREGIIYNAIFYIYIFYIPLFLSLFVVEILTNKRLNGLIFIFSGILLRIWCFITQINYNISNYLFDILFFVVVLGIQLSLIWYSNKDKKQIITGVLSLSLNYLFWFLIFIINSYYPLYNYWISVIIIYPLILLLVSITIYLNKNSTDNMRSKTITAN